MNFVTHIKLRPATEADREFINKLTCLTMMHNAEIQWPNNPKEWQSCLKNAKYNPDRPTRIAEYNGQQVGRITAGPYAYDRMGYTHWIHVDEIQVLPEFQGHGIGSYMLKAVLEDARVAKLPVTLSVIKSNSAVRFYEKLGFIRHEYIKPPYDGWAMIYTRSAPKPVLTRNKAKTFELGPKSPI